MIGVIVLANSGWRLWSRSICWIRPGALNNSALLFPNIGVFALNVYKILAAEIYLKTSHCTHQGWNETRLESKCQWSLWPQDSFDCLGSLYPTSIWSFRKRIALELSTNTRRPCDANRRHQQPCWWKDWLYKTSRPFRSSDLHRSSPKMCWRGWASTRGSGLSDQNNQSMLRCELPASSSLEPSAMSTLVADTHWLTWTGPPVTVSAL